MKRLLFTCISILAACAPGREPTTVALELAITLPTTANDHGWTTEVTSLDLAFDGVRLHEGDPLLSALGKSLWGLFGGVAHAHPGHYTAGEAVGEWLGTVTIDAWRGPFTIGTADAFTGHVGSGWLSFGTLAGGGSIHLAGVARKQDETRPFDVRLTLATDLSGIAGSHTLTTTPDAATVTIDVARWLVAADFSTTRDADNDGTFELPDDSQARRALQRGTVDVGAYALRWAGAP